MTSVWIGLGTNIEPRETHFIRALEKISSHQQIEMKHISSIYETEPVDYTDQADFLNMVVEIETELNPDEVLRYCQEIENDLGRVRTVRYGPRTLDLDVLIYGKEIVDAPDLSVPHPRMQERVFVLVPLAEINEDIYVPGLDKTVQEILIDLPEADRTGIYKWPKENKNVE